MACIAHEAVLPSSPHRNICLGVLQRGTGIDIVVWSLAIMQTLLNNSTTHILEQPYYEERHADEDEGVFAAGGTGVDCTSVPSSQRFSIFCSKTPMSPSSKIRRRCSLRSRSLFFGNMPETACRIICNRQRVIGNRASLYRITTHLVGLSPHHISVPNLLQTTGKHRVVPIYELLSLVTGHLHVPRIRDDHVVTAVD